MPRRPSSQAHRDAVKRWQKKHLEAGNCTRCGKSRNLYAFLCDKCRKKMSNWKPGNRGRRPKWAKGEEASP